MSHYIEGVEVNDHQIFHQRPARQLIAPKYRKKFHGIQPMKAVPAKYLQQIAIRNICRKLNERELNKLQKQNVIYIEHQLSKMKSKIKKQLTSKKSVADFLEPNKSQQKLNLKQVLSHMPKKVQIAKKYNSKMVNNLEMIREAENINSCRLSMNNWYDKQRNSPLKSPNYQHMNFVFEKLRNSKSILSPLSKILKKEPNHFLQKNKTHYQPINRRIKTLGNQTYIRISR